MPVIGEHGAVVHEVTVDASPDLVYEFLAEPEKMSRWMGVSAQVDREAGTWRVELNENGWVTAGEIVERDPPHRLLLTFGWEPPDAPAPLPPGASTVEITLTAEGERTRVRLEHRDLPPELRVVHGAGWELGLSRLAVAVTGADPGPHPLSSVRTFDELAPPAT